MRAALLIFSSCLMGRNWFEGKHMRHVFCFHPSLIELQRAGSVCVMKFVLVICFHTLQPAALPSDSNQAPMCWCTTPTRSEHTGMMWSSAHEPRARLHDCEPFIKHADANEHQRVNIFTQSTLSDQSQSHGCVFNSSCFKQKVSSIIYFAWLFSLKSQIGVRFIRGEDSQMDRRLSYYGELLLGP